MVRIRHRRFEWLTVAVGLGVVALALTRGDSGVVGVLSFLLGVQLSRLVRA